ncbi:hypothetical protein U0070_017198 [Myodes glareolus]|uniref:Pentatricopeptide repeat domain 3 n=1 Tax=Myodes glareolus TaxID=447135 RepID=A0AAW0HXB4_MYOGA
MAAAMSARYLGFRSGPALLQTARGPGVCEAKLGCRDKVAVLQALATTVNRDPTAVPYVYQDDPYLIPTSTVESRSFLLAKKSGENAAKFIINSHPKYFQKDVAEPHIPCLMPESFEPQIEDVSEAALEERIRLRKVKASVDIFDQLLQAGTTVSLETTNSLLDLLCYYGDQEPPADYPFQQTEHTENLEEATEESNQTSKMKTIPWKTQNNAERIFALMPEKNAHSYCTMIRGMVKDLLKHMVAQKVKPNLQTFNAVLKGLRKFYLLGRLPALQTLREMKYIGIDNSLFISLFFYLLGNLRTLTCNIPSYYSSLLSARDLELAYQIHRLLNTGDNRKLIGSDLQLNFYYSKFFSLICSMEQIDVTLKWYKDLIPSVFFPHSQTLIGLLQALDVANRLEMVPQIWKDSKEYGHTFRDALRQEILMLMARDKHPQELQVAFADCAADIKSTYESQDARQTSLDWPANSLQCIAVLFLRGGRTQEAWKMLALFKKHNKIPRGELLEEFMNTAKASENPALAIEVVKLASAFSLPVCESLAQRVMTDFTVDEKQKEALGNLTAPNSSNGDSSSDSDSDISEDKRN